MVKICSNEHYPSPSPYDEHFSKYPFPLSDFQKYAIEAILTGNHTLVTAHTGSGKTLPAEFAIDYFVTTHRKKVIYTSPIKALSNQKYYEFTQKYPHISFGLLTGDIKTNPDADVLIMTTEILMNSLIQRLSNTDSKDSKDSISNLQFQMDIDQELACVIFDEVHYINDEDRGQTWEKTILLLPPHIQMVMLSATIDRPEQFAQWCEDRGRCTSTSTDTEDAPKKEVYLASTNHRVVPLSHYAYLTTTESFIKTLKDKALEKQIREGTNKMILLQNAHGQFQEPGYRELARLTKLMDKPNKPKESRKHVLNNMALFLRDREMLPAIAFVFSRKQVEQCAQDITVPLLEDDSKVGYIVARECDQIIRKLPNYQEYANLQEYQTLVSLLQKGIGIHHSGMIPILREIVELMISKKYIKFLFATESFAIGLDCPIKTTIFTGISKFDGSNHRPLHSHEYTQMAGRAGRRGIDTIGYVMHCNNLFDLPTESEYRAMLCGRPQELVSKFKLAYSLILNGTDLVKQTMMYGDLSKEVYRQTTALQTMAQKTLEKAEFIKGARTPEETCREYLAAITGAKQSTNKKRKEYEKTKERILEEYRYCVQDAKAVEEYDDLVRDYKKQEDYIRFLTTYVEEQTEKQRTLLLEEGFFEQVDETLGLTYSGRMVPNLSLAGCMVPNLSLAGCMVPNLSLAGCMVPNLSLAGCMVPNLSLAGRMAAKIAEIHPLVISKLVTGPWNYMADFSPVQIVGLFSCFVDNKVPDDERHSVPQTQDAFLKARILEMKKLYETYAKIEEERDIRSGSKYDDALQYDLVDCAMMWCYCKNEAECREFIETKVKTSIGDFVKAMLKISTIAKEIGTIAEELGQLGLVHKLSQIDGLLLKYVTTTQSLYV
jgi:superfamily II RNA helicase